MLGPVDPAVVNASTALWALSNSSRIGCRDLRLLLLGSELEHHRRSIPEQRESGRIQSQAQDPEHTLKRIRRATPQPIPATTAPDRPSSRSVDRSH